MGIFFAALFAALNLRGVETSARINAAVAAGLGIVIAIFFVAAFRLHLPAERSFVRVLSRSCLQQIDLLSTSCVSRNLDCGAYFYRL
jgi:hypothetical protein